ncbi:PREDICTED: uncharacterized protein LOC100640581 isoform X2 [Amphimedon queenslandica]|uniref:Spermatogenesis-associated protein 13 n=1 Tax=Amphimedon queenslandica TaxID=400682 RepID=A0AAN0J724_AMPQE|nr:PREDICTED: uncharacterized protein LOC100640581 isoform X2 [Amphimedon queenslandica]|eukprot:XP_019852562.1 PREDICTED: uncharacterized protein LOC100640581 isoform X2 [Amphimedon queenslandica]
MMSDKATPPKVSAMISVFDGKKEQPPPATKASVTPPTVGVSVPRRKLREAGSPEKKPQGQNDETKPVPSVTMTGPFKLIHVSGSGQVVDEKAPMLSRTLNHFKSGGNLSSTKPASGKGAAKEPAIKPMGYQSSPTHGGRKISAPVTINCSVPRKERKAQEKLKESQEEEESILSKSTPQFSSPNRSSDSHSVSPSPPSKKPNPRQSSLPSETMPTTSSCAIKQPGGTWFPSSRRSYRNTEAPPPVQFRVRTWDRLSTGNTRQVKRSQSFTSRTKTEASGERQRSTSPSSSSSSSSSPQKKSLGGAKPNSIDLNTRSQSALAGSLTEEEIDERISASVHTSPAPARRDDKSRSVVLSPQISVEVSRNKYWSSIRPQSTFGKASSPQLGSKSKPSTTSGSVASSNSSLPPPVPPPKPTRSTDSQKSKTLPSRRSVGGYSPTHTSSAANRLSQYQSKGTTSKEGGPATGFMKKDSPRDGKSPTMGSSKRESAASIKKEGSPVFSPAKRNSLKKESSPVLSTRSTRKEGSPVMSASRDSPRRGSPNLPSTKRESLASVRKDAPKNEAGSSSSKLQRPVQRSRDYANVQFSHDTTTSSEGRRKVSNDIGSTASDHIDYSPGQKKKIKLMERKDSKDKSMTLPGSSRATASMKKHHDTESVPSSSPRLSRLAMERRGSPSTPPLSIKSRIAIFQTKEDVSLSSTLPRNMYSSSNKRPVSEYNQVPLMRERDPGAKDKRKSLPAPPIPPKPRKPAVSRVILESAPVTLEEEEDDEGDRESKGRGRMRIHSDKTDGNNDSEIKVHIFQEGESEQATPFTDAPANVYDDVVFSEDTCKVDRAEKPRSTRYSYQEYATMRRMTLLRNSTSSSSVSEANNNDKGLAAIPENTLSVGQGNKKEEKKEEKEKEEPDLFKRMSVISGTFYEEMIDSIALKLASSEEKGRVSEGGASLERIEKVKKQLIEVVEDAVSNDPLIESEEFYESLEEYGRKVSDYLHRTQGESTSEEVPPELPPRPDFLLKLIKEDNEGGEDDVDRGEMSSPSILKLEGYEEMSSASIDVQPPSTVSLYEPVSFDVTMSPKGKGKRRTSKIPFWRSPEHKPSSPTLSLDSATLSLPKSGSNKKSNKKKKIMPSFSVRRSVKVEPTITSPVRSVSVSGHTCHSVTSSPSHTTYEEMNAPTSSPPHMYVNISRSVSVSQPYEFVSTDEPIQPTYSSESEGEDVSGVYDDIRSPVKRIWKDIEPPATPESSVFTDDHDTCDGRSLHDPTASPLVTKIRSTHPTHQYLRTSSSDSALHLSFIATGRPFPPTSPIPSFGEMSMDSNSNVESSPSICSYDSNRHSGGVGGVELKASPMCSLSRKRVKSDASEDRYHSARKGAQQKARLMMMANHRRRRRGSVPGNPETSSVDGIIEVPIVYADALMDCTGVEPSHLSFKVNDVIAILNMTDDDWWQGIVEDRIGWFSSAWVRLRINQEDNDTTSLHDRSEQAVSSSPGQESSGAVPTGSKERRGEEKPSEAGEGERKDEEATEQDTLGDLEQVRKHKPVTRRRTIRKRDSGDLPRSLLPSQIRAKCIEEILNTERVYVQHLKNIVEGFLYPCRERVQLFSQERVETIFSNIEDIYRFQQNFLDQLESRINFGNLEDSLIGEIFVIMKDSFSMYSEYCNNHPHAVNEMNLLQQDQQYVLFFEACRLLKEMADISLEGFLLNPVQRICRYPLQLSELKKYTPESHPDYCHVVAAQAAMTQVAILINERKRRMEALGRLRTWQTNVENWKGADLMETSTELIHGTELHKISKGRCQERHFFLFDHQLVYCKKDTIGGRLSYKGRVNTDKCQIIDLKDGEWSHGGNGVKNAWRINNFDKDDKWYVLFAKNAKMKEEWMEAFKKERRQVEDDKINGFIITPKMKRAAIALFNTTSEPISRKHPPKKNYEGSRKRKIKRIKELTRHIPFSKSKNFLVRVYQLV